MNRNELFEYHKDICAQALAIMVKKNNDYAGADGETPFANFERTETMGICSTEQSFLVRMTDKMSRLSTFVSTGELKVTNESYKDAVLDLINYLILFGAYVDTKESKQKIGAK
jgi:hypothetical protein